MKNTYTTGELAKLCGVSVRTVQFYDREGIVPPTALSEGGRRIYSEGDLERFRFACLYRSLGFSLGEIRGIVSSGKGHEQLAGILREQIAKTDAEIGELTRLKARLNALREEILESGHVAVGSDEELTKLIVRKKKHRKTDILTYVFLGLYLAIMAMGFPLAVRVGGPYPILMLVVVAVLLVGLIYYHASVNAYICPRCGHKFTIGFFRDMLSPNGVRKGKYLRCPACRKRSWMRETYRDE